MYRLPPDRSHVTIGFCAARGFFSRAIRWFGVGVYSHVTTLLPDRERVIDARLHGGVAVRPVSYLANERVFWVDIGCTGAQAKSVYNFLHAQVGKKYDVQGIIDFAVGVEQFHDWRYHTSAWFCDELAAASWIEAGIAKNPWLPLCRITPGASAILASQLDWRKSEFKITKGAV